MNGVHNSKHTLTKKNVLINDFCSVMDGYFVLVLGIPNFMKRGKCVWLNSMHTGEFMMALLAFRFTFHINVLAMPCLNI